MFLDDLKEELETIKTVQIEGDRNKQLKAYQNKLASLTFLDPAAGSGNFLTETYLSLRRLENDVLGMLYGDQIMLGDETFNPIKVSIGQFYGIEINDFAVTVAKTALWIAESQMLKETEKVIRMDLDFLPLKSYTNIVEGNALRMDWNDVIPASRLNYVYGNPPFSGTRLMNQSQKQDILHVFGKNWNSVNSIDYVSAWYKRSAELININPSIKSAYVSTNSIVQGEQVSALWKPLFNDYKIKISFAYQTFNWDSEANEKAHVHCVIIGFGANQKIRQSTLYSGGTKLITENINAYLHAAPDIFIERHDLPLCNVPQIYLGCTFNDNNNLIIEEAEKEALCSKDPKMKQFIRPYYMGKDFINRKPRYCFWLLTTNPSELKTHPEIMHRIQKVRDFRLQCKNQDTVKSAETPYLPSMLRYYAHDFGTDYIAIPKVSSQRRRYIPMELLPGNAIAGDKIFLMPNATNYTFGIMTSNVHMAWVRAFCGRLKSDFSYSSKIVYNSFPWPNPTPEQKERIEKTAQAILDARALYPDSSLADLYDELTMPPELRTAHQNNDRAVMAAYGFPVKNFTEADCVAALMKMYQKLTEEKS